MTARTRRLLTATLCAAMMLAGGGCGKSSEDGTEQETVAAPAVPANRYPKSAAPYRAGFSERTPVPGGLAVLGARWWQASSSRFRPLACSESVANRASVAPFRLMHTEVTNAQYATCVREDGCKPPDASPSGDGAGAWDDPAQASRPVAIGYRLAFDFCRIYGGELPSEGQFIRATEGDAPAFGIEALTDRFTRCALGEAHPMCDVLYDAAAGIPDARGQRLGRGQLGDVGTADWDVAPFGHRDLFANSWEWVRAVDDEHWPPAGRGCATWQEDLRYDTTRKAPQPSERAFHLGWSCRSGAGVRFGALATEGETYLMHASAPMTVEALAGQDGSLGPLAHNGFRCAFPP